jgi:hypothetical protein
MFKKIRVAFYGFRYRNILKILNKIREEKGLSKVIFE